MKLVEQKIDFTNCNAVQVEETFKKETKFFENAIVREEIYKLNALLIAAKNEFVSLHERKDQIEKLEHTRRMRWF